MNGDRSNGHVNLRVASGLYTLLLIWVTLSVSLGCATSSSSPPEPTSTQRELSFNVNSVPDGAEIMLDGRSHGRTPSTIRIQYRYEYRGFSDDENRVRRLEVRKSGYEPYQTTFTIRDEQYERIPNPIRLTQKIASSVAVTGSASALRRLTTGGPVEIALDLSNDKRWLLIQVSETPNSNRVIQKLDLTTGTRTVLSSGLSDDREASWLPDLSGFVFASERLGNYSLVRSLGVSGETGVQFITQAALGNTRYPRVAPDGEDIAFSVVGGRSSSRATLAVIGMDGRDLRMYGPGRQPNWSPDKTEIVFARQVGSYSHLFKLESKTGANLVQISSAAANDRSPSWSPDGEHVAFISDRVLGNRHMFVMDKNGGQVAQLTEGNFNISALTWGVDDYIYFSADAGENIDIWRLRYVPN